MKYLILVLLFININSEVIAGIPIYGDVETGALFKRVAEEEFCRHRRVVIHGVKNYLRVRNYCNQEQIKIVTGILYIQEFYSPEHIYISPLPSSNTLKRYSKRFHVIYSRSLSFYVDFLRKDLQIISTKVSSPLELDTVLPRILQETELFLLLPDPVFYDAKGFAILRYWLKRYPNVKVLDLANLNIEHPNIIRIKIEKHKYFQLVREIYNRDNLQRGMIYYVDY